MCLSFSSSYFISSTPSNGLLCPAVYSVIEDVIATDGGGVNEFRYGLNRRYEESEYCWKMFHFPSLLWSISAVMIGTAVTIIDFQTDISPAAAMTESTHFLKPPP